MNITDLIPYKWYAIGGAFALVVAALGGQTLRLAHEHTAHQTDLVRAEHERVRGALAVIETEEKYRSEEQRRAKAQKDIDDESHRMAATARADLASADAARVRLLQRVRTAGAQATGTPGHPAPVVVGSPAGDPIGVLADVLGRADARAGLLADFADRAHAAGIACERSYDALTK